MTLQRGCIWLLVMLAFSSISARASAEVVIDWVKVGDPGNPESPATKKDGTSGYGAVDYTFRMGKYETTNFQYAEFLNSVAATDTNDLYDADMESLLEGGITRSGISGSYTYSVKANMDNKPVNFVSWFDSARFANWLHNGQPVGTQSALTTEDGAYTFSGPEAVSTRNDGARFFLPNEHEWDKTAFYEPGADTLLGDGWWTYPSHSDVYPSPARTDAIGNVVNPGPHVVVFQRTANWNGSTVGNVTTVGSAGNESYYGARDMTGNVYEWVTADPDKPDPNGWGPYTVRGGSFISAGHVYVEERNLVHHHNHAVVDRTVGFRLASAYVGGDFNNDFFANGTDLTLWEKSYPGPRYDLNNDGQVSGSDFLQWQRSYDALPPGVDESPANLDQQGLVDSDDIRVWAQSYAVDDGGDLDGDGDADGLDFLELQREITPYDVADKNRDRLVDGRDLKFWTDSFGYDGVVDTDGDGVATGMDFLIWQQQFDGASLSAASSVAPEPTGMTLALAAVFSLAGFAPFRRRR